MIIDALTSAFKFLSIMIPFMVIGIVLAELLIELKLVHKIGFLMLPVTKFAHLRTECGLSFLTAFGSPVAANSMLMEYHNNNLIDRKELFIASLATSFPVVLMEWQYLLPVLIPLLGFTGITYYCLLILCGLIVTVIALFAGRLLLPEKDDVARTDIEKRPPLKIALNTSVRSSKKTIKRILGMTIPITIIVFLLIDIGIFEMLTDYLGSIATYLPIPGAGLSIIAAQFANHVAAYTIAGSLLSEGVLDGKNVVLTLLVGDVLSSFAGLRYLIPYYLGIFGTNLGTQIMVLATTLRLSVMVLIIIVLMLGW